MKQWLLLIYFKPYTTKILEDYNPIAIDSDADDLVYHRI